jgi:hypothetical protein
MPLEYPIECYLFVGITLNRKEEYNEKLISTQQIMVREPYISFKCPQQESNFNPLAESGGACNCIPHCSCGTSDEVSQGLSTIKELASEYL